MYHITITRKYYWVIYRNNTQEVARFRTKKDAKMAILGIKHNYETLNRIQPLITFWTVSTLGGDRLTVYTDKDNVQFRDHFIIKRKETVPVEHYNNFY